MNKTKIEWCDYTWNPITGCFHGCKYCYADKIAMRFGGGYGETNGTHVLDSHVEDPYPFGFDPTFHRYRLDEPQGKKPGKVFVCSMADLFGEWVPDSWIKEVLAACDKALQHKYLFLTKNPKRYDDIGVDEECHNITVAPRWNDDENNMFFGATVTNYGQLSDAYESTATWLSIEPLCEELGGDECFNYPDNPAAPYNAACKRWEWVVIGADSSRGKNRIVPKREWVEDIVSACRSWGTPIFMKSNLASVWGGELIQEYPEGLK